ncbi:MAG: TolC family protein, partial [Candidatus Sumerlaeota bacterium]|nr:TolC family protein [Candidatus Sumerlaeota bacterium]
MTGFSNDRRRTLLAEAGLAVLAVCAVCCAYHPRWTPETVAPPASLAVALDNADRAWRAGQATLPTDRATTLPLTRDGAILTGVTRNRSLAVERFGPEISRTSIDEARAAFDPSLTGSASYGRSTRPAGAGGGSVGTASAPVGTGSSTGSGGGAATSVTTRNFNTSLQINETLPTGTELFLSGAYAGQRTLPPWIYTGSWSAGFNQSLLRGMGVNVNLVTLRQARNTFASSQHQLRGFVLDLVQQIETAYWELALADETLRIREFSVRLANEQLQLNEDMIAVGKLAPSARFTAEAELATREADLVDAQAGVKSRTLDLIRLLDPDHVAQWEIHFDPKDPPEVERVEVMPDVSATLAKQYRPELAQSRLDLANRDLDVVQTRNGLLPNLTGFGSYGRMSAGTDSHQATDDLDSSKYDNYQVGLSLQMDPLDRAERAARARARFQQQQAEAAVRNLEQQVDSDVRHAAVEVQRQWERIPATQKAVRSGEEDVQVQQSRFAVGIGTNIDVLTVQRSLIQSQLDEVTARIKYIEALTALYHS